MVLMALCSVVVVARVVDVSRRVCPEIDTPEGMMGRCNGLKECSRDERDCGDCSQFQGMRTSMCNYDGSTECIYPMHICDGQSHCKHGICQGSNCADAEDEASCVKPNMTLLGDRTFRCGETSQWVIPCNGKRECKNEEDDDENEDLCNPSTLAPFVKPENESLSTPASPAETENKNRSTAAPPVKAEKENNEGGIVEALSGAVGYGVLSLCAVVVTIAGCIIFHYRKPTSKRQKAGTFDDSQVTMGVEACISTVGVVSRRSSDLESQLQRISGGIC